MAALVQVATQTTQDKALNELMRVKKQLKTKEIEYDTLYSYQKQTQEKEYEQKYEKDYRELIDRIIGLDKDKKNL